MLLVWLECSIIDKSKTWNKFKSRYYIEELTDAFFYKLLALIVSIGDTTLNCNFKLQFYYFEDVLRVDGLK